MAADTVAFVTVFGDCNVVAGGGQAQKLRPYTLNPKP
jgi:hypothetical protein